MEVKSILSEEGKQLLVVNNFKFCVARTMKFGGVVSTKNQTALQKCKPSNVISSDHNHNHPEEENIERQALSNGVKRKALDNLTHKPAKLLRQELR
jgi:hypothetical protein